ncbi:hypothetical protein JXA48_02590 [Candidatus Woesearchaeota archaeon]|nr:hypothetical protein [Candidatus Woesearchaeota archaeon]
MAPKKRKTVVAKVKKKKWFPIYAPKSFGEVMLGESYVSEAEELNGKYITSNLSTITRSMRKQSVNVQFKVTSVVEGKGQTETVGYSLINAAVKRLVRRGRDKVSDSFLAKTSDKKILRFKPIIITNNHGTNSVQSALRLEARRLIREYAFTKTVEEIFKEVSDGKIQKTVKDACGKIFPIRGVDLKAVKLLENTDIVVTDKEVVSEKVVIRKKDKGVAHAVEDEKSETDADVTQEDAEDKAVDELTEDVDDSDFSESESVADDKESEELPNATEEEDENSEDFDEEAEEDLEESGVADDEESDEESDDEPKKEE